MRALLARLNNERALDLILADKLNQAGQSYEAAKYTRSANTYTRIINYIVEAYNARAAAAATSLPEVSGAQGESGIEQSA